MIASLLFDAEIVLVRLTHAAWQAGLLAIVVFTLTSILGRRLEPRWRFALWLIVFARLALPVLPATSWSLFQVFSYVSTPREAVALTSSATLLQRIADGQMKLWTDGSRDGRLVSHTDPQSIHKSAEFLGNDEVAAHSPKRVILFALWIWIAGVVLLSLRRLASLVQLRRRQRRWQQVADPHVLSVLRECSSELRFCRGLSLYTTPDNLGPATCGIVHPCIVLPQILIDQLSREELRLVLLHELVHVRRRDVLADQLIGLVTIVHWFHPVGWISRHFLRSEREFACDAAVLEQSPTAKSRDYGHVILKTIELLAAPFAPLPGLVGMFSRSSSSLVQRRIRMIATHRCSTWPSWLLGSALLSGLVLVGLTDAQSKRQPRDPEHELAASPGQNQPVTVTQAPKDAVEEDALRGAQPDKQDDLTWSDIAPGQRLEVLESMKDQTRANFERIHTWESTWAVTMSQFLSDAYVASSFGSQLINGAPTGGLMQEFTFNIKTVIDAQTSKAYRDKVTSKMRFVSYKTGDPLDVPNTSAADGRSVVNSDEFLSYSPEKVWGGFSFLPDHPDAQRKRTAFRESPEEAKNQSHGDLLDPMKFFGVNETQQFWDILGQYVEAERGGHGSSPKLKLEEASKDGRRYFRTQMTFEKPELHVTMTWSAAAGFNPLSFAMSSDTAGKRLLAEQQWAWRKSDGIYVPESHSEVSYFAEDGRASYRRDVILTVSKLNQPIDSNLFTYRGLGMGDGDLIVDRMKKVVLIIKNGEAVKLANFKPSLPALPSELLKPGADERSLKSDRQIRLDLKLAEFSITAARRRGVGFSDVFTGQKQQDLQGTAGVVAMLTRIGALKIVAEPSLIVADGRPGYFFSGPIVAGHKIGSQIQWTAQLLDKSRVKLDLHVIQTDQEVATRDGMAPAFRTSETDKSFEMDLGKTMISAGAVQTQSQRVTDPRTRRRSTSQVQTQMLYFVTPQLIAPAERSAATDPKG